MNVKQIVTKHLKDIGADGLCCQNCGCVLGNLMVCNGNFSACEPGKLKEITEPDEYYDIGDEIVIPIEEVEYMSDLQSSSAHRGFGLITRNQRRLEFKRIVSEMRYPEERDLPPTIDEIDGMQDLCYRLYSAEAAAKMAKHLGVSVQQVREALDIGVLWR